MSKKSKDFRQMTAETAGVDLLNALVQEIKLLPDVWPKISKAKQDDVIDRLRKRVHENVNMIVHLISAQDRVVVAGALDQITIKDGVKAVVKFGIKSPNLDGLYEAASEGKDVLVVVAGAKDYMNGMNEVKGEDDQRNIDLGHEYHDNDGGGMDDKDIEDVDEIKGLPEKVITQEDLESAYQDGWTAAEEGKKQIDCPIMDPDLVAKWVRGFKDFIEQSESDDKDAA